MKLLTTGIMSLLAFGLLLSPFVSSFPFISNVFAQEEINEENAPVKQVLLVANENMVQVAPDNALHPGGIEYAAMTFNGTIPAPPIAGDHGDLLNITIRNDGKTIHSLDFHAGVGPSKVLSGNIPPGESRHVPVLLENPGVFMYHCGADGLNGVWEHIANGMYGALVVHPQNEQPAKEFYLSFGEIFNTADKGLFVGSNGTVGTFDLTKFATDQPDLILTNGMAHKYAPGLGETAKIVLNENPELFKVKPGELTRWYILNPGPNGGVSFHFISGQIDVRDGSNPDKTDYGTQLLNDETWWIPPGSASVIESVFPEAGAYVGVDHNMMHVVRGGALIVMAEDNSTAQDHPPGTSVAPKGSQSAVAEWGKPVPYEQIIAEASADTGAITSNATLAYAQGEGNDTMSMGNDTSMTMNATLPTSIISNATLAYAQGDGMMGNDTGMMNATLAYAQENTVSMPPGSSNPSAAEFFVPKEITVSPGTTVTWTNDDSTIHTVVEGSAAGAAGEAPVFDSSIMAPGASFEYTFDTAGEFDYFCNLHPFMTGKVTVS
jgi:nitrite reductase (NO-forming)